MDSSRSLEDKRMLIDFEEFEQLSNKEYVRLQEEAHNLLRKAEGIAALYKAVKEAQEARIRALGEPE